MTSDVLPAVVAVSSHELAERPWRPFGGMPHVRVKHLGSTPDAVAGLLAIDAGGQELRHLHVHDDHHVWVVDGTLLIDGTVLETGSYVHVPKGVPHTMRAEAGHDCTLFFVYCHSDHLL